MGRGQRSGMSLMAKIRMLTFHRAVNNGAVLQAFGLLEALKTRFPESDVRVLDYRAPRLALYDLLKVCRPETSSPLFNYRRYRLIQDWVSRTLELDPALRGCSDYASLVRQLDDLHADVVIVGSDCVWRLGDALFWPKFPSIYWLSDTLDCKKVSYAASAHETAWQAVEPHAAAIRRIVGSYDLVSVRDQATADMLGRCGVEADVCRVPDPAFLCPVGETAAVEKMARAGWREDTPTCALLHYGKNPAVEQIAAHVRSRGYQLVGLSMYSPYVDVNLGDVLDPLEWADAFRHVDCCVTDRFHGAVFCLRAETPFVAIETAPGAASKKRQLLEDFDALECWLDISAADYALPVFEARFRDVTEQWQAVGVPKVRAGLERVQEQSEAFLDRIEALVNDD